MSSRMSAGSPLSRYRKRKCPGPNRSGSDPGATSAEDSAAEPDRPRRGRERKWRSDFPWLEKAGGGRRGREVALCRLCRLAELGGGAGAQVRKVYLLAKKGQQLQLCGDLLILQDGLESLAASSGLSSVIESLESCTSNYTNKVLPGDSLVSVSTPMRLAPMFKKAYIEPEHADGVLKALGLLWRQGKLCDAVICSGDNKIMLHRLLLFAVSPHLLEKNIRDGAELEVNLPGGIGDEALAAFVSFLYDGVLNLTENMYKDVERIGTLLKVEKVIRYCKEFLVSLTEHRNALSQPQSHVSDGHPENSRRKRGRHSKQTVVVNLAEESCHEDQRTTYLSHPDFPAFPGSTSKDRGCSNTEMPVTFPDSQEYCIPSTSHLSSVYSPISGQVKTEPYQMVEDFSANFSSNKGPNKLSEKNDGFLHQDSLGQGIESRCGSSKDNRNFSPNSIEQLPTATTGSGRSLKPASKSQSPGTKYDQQGSVITQSSGTSPFPVSLVASSGETFPLYSLQSS